MPLLKYRCTACGVVFDALVSSSSVRVSCEACGGEVERAYEGKCLFGMSGSPAGRASTCDGQCGGCSGCASTGHASGCNCGACH